MKFKDELTKNMLQNNQDFKSAFENTKGFEAVKEKLKSSNELMQEFKEATYKDFETSKNANFKAPVSLNFIKNIITTEIESIEAKQDQMANLLQGNINLLFSAKDTEREIMEYKGFKVVGIATKTAFEGNVVYFKLINNEQNIELEPRSLEYKDDKYKGISAREQINFKGFITRINNVLSDEALQKRLQRYTDELKILKETNATLKEWALNNQTYPKQELLEKLQKDLEICNIQNDKMAINRRYKSNWQSTALIEYKNWDKAQKAKLMQNFQDQNIKDSAKNITLDTQDNTKNQKSIPCEFSR